MQETLHDIIKAEKKAQNVTIERLSAAADISQSTISRLLSGAIQSPSVYAVGRMCALLHISLDEYFEIDVPNAHALENEALRAAADSHARMEDIWKAAIAKKDKVIRWLIVTVVALALLSVGSYLIWDFTHTDWGFYRG